MKKIVVVAGVILLVTTAIAFRYGHSVQNAPVPASPAPSAANPTRQNSPPPTATVTPSVWYPLNNYSERLTARRYGQTVTAADQKSVACGATFEGIHTGDDLEVDSSELNQDVPVFSITDGVVRQVGTVSGYGGLLVIEHQLHNQPVTAYYGHVNLVKTLLKTGEQVSGGQQIAVLGAPCSKETGGERKHLHFALRQGTAIDVRGYVPSQDQLQAWLNPQVTLDELKAGSPPNVVDPT